MLDVSMPAKLGGNVLGSFTPFQLFYTLAKPPLLIRCRNCACLVHGYTENEEISCSTEECISKLEYNVFNVETVSVDLSLVYVRVCFCMCFPQL